MKAKTTNIDKLRGGYYTPSAVADWLCNWAIRNKSDSVFEPSCGEGVFLRAAGNRLLELGVSKNKLGNSLQGVELVGKEADSAKVGFVDHFKTKTAPNIETSDLFQWLLKNPDKQFDVAVGNPPFIRYQNFPDPSRALAMTMMEKHGLKPNKLTNIWVPFVVAATTRIRPGGRIAMVVPAELLQVSYAGQLRMFLVDQFRRIEIVTCNEMFFKGAEQEVVLLLAEEKLDKLSPANRCQINMSEFPSVAAMLNSSVPREYKTKKYIQHDTEKWLKYFLTAREIDFMREVRKAPNVTELRAHASVDVGVVTGKNEFFVKSQKEILANGLQDYILPLVGRSAQLEGATFSVKDFKALVEKNGRIYLFYVPTGASSSLPKEVRRYIAMGEAEKFHEGYKCSIRLPWFTVPTVWKPDCFLFRQIYDFPRVVLNQTNATSTDTIHRMTCNKAPALVAASVYTYLTAASAEIEGRSYGGGVLELEPTEAERLLVPMVLGGGLPLKEIDVCIRDGGLESVLAENDRLILKKQMGFTNTECNILKEIWTRMKTRRWMRGKKR